jgi:hypothetical protein
VPHREAIWLQPAVPFRFPSNSLPDALAACRQNMLAIMHRKL